jgi:TRAP-type C4-dicarboxylate transport system permease small subunit
MLSYAAMFCGSHSGLKRRTSIAVDVLTDKAPHPAHRRLLGTVILGPTHFPKKTFAFITVLS